MYFRVEYINPVIMPLKHKGEDSRTRKVGAQKENLITAGKLDNMWTWERSGQRTARSHPREAKRRVGRTNKNRQEQKYKRREMRTWGDVGGIFKRALEGCKLERMEGYFSERWSLTKRVVIDIGTRDERGDVELR
jgi:hypothetical protein